MPSSLSALIARVRRIPPATFWLPLALGCQANLGPPTQPNIDDIFWNLKLSHHAVTMSTTAPYDTLTVTATPRNRAGVPLAGLPAVQYTTTDARSVAVTSDGMLVAVSPTSFNPAQVIATMTAGNLRHTDTVYVKVVDTPTPPVLGNLSIHPVPPDSAKRAANPFYVNPLGTLKIEAFLAHPFPVRVSDTADNTLSGVLVFLESADTLTARFGFGGTGRVVEVFAFPFIFNRPSIVALRPGFVNLYASTTVFGVTKVDTLRYEVGWPVAAMIQVNPFATRGPGNFFTEASGIPGGLSIPGVQVKIGAGGVVAWMAKGVAEATDVVFDDPTNVRGVEIAAPLLNTNWYPLWCTDYLITGCATGGDFVLPPTPSVVADSESIAYRAFPVPGVYEFHNRLNGANGRIVVVGQN